MTQSIARLSVVSGGAKEKTLLFEACADISSDLQNITGYAIVAWNDGGEIRSAIYSGGGPIGLGMIPTLAHDALNRHVALEMAPPSKLRD
jgi:hypothetical protein